MALGGEEEEEEELVLEKGSFIRTPKATYSVHSLIGEGNFGAVYRVVDSNNPSRIYAMKIEKKMEDPTKSKLKMEIKILRSLGDKKHFTQLIDEGHQEAFSFLIMELLGKNLQDLKNGRPNQMIITAPTIILYPVSTGSISMAYQIHSRKSKTMTSESCWLSSATLVV
ncbi:hypothetical protein Y032_0626g822 [Ancylostoma ceylanicum]|uniref:Protein kinase domain-containing protein n=1 Tax=Ancylostoma ceylanicum TaxID=53326 RepID=A0A016WK19_9BILA|nr:hypothetical protein Y032_0626g822 [Ancylostoma ceylanicum]